jgi:hypothetical protein
MMRRGMGCDQMPKENDFSPCARNDNPQFIDR